MFVRVVVLLKDRDSVRRLVHATRFEPSSVDADKCVLAFDVPFRRVEAVLDRIARSGVGDFLAHLTPISEGHETDGSDVTKRAKRRKQ